MPRARKARDPEAGGRERLLRAAVRLFAAKGYAATTVRDILKAARVTAPVLYYHFGSKEGIFLALVREGLQKVDAALDESLGEAGTASARIRGYCRAAAKVRREYADLARIAEAILSGPPEAGPSIDLHALVASRVRRVEALVREGIRNGEFRKCDPLHATLALIGAVEIAARPHMFGPGTSNAANQLEGMVSVILCGLAAPRASRARSRR